MRWEEIRRHHPHQWLVVEALHSRTHGGRREPIELTVLALEPDGASAWASYLTLHRQAPERELYILHTDRAELSFEEQDWRGLRVAG
jgi:hypothetical protein